MWAQRPEQTSHICHANDEEEDEVAAVIRRWVRSTMMRICSAAGTKTLGEKRNFRHHTFDDHILISYMSPKYACSIFLFIYLFHSAFFLKFERKIIELFPYAAQSYADQYYCGRPSPNSLKQRRHSLRWSFFDFFFLITLCVNWNWVMNFGLETEMKNRMCWLYICPCEMISRCECDKIKSTDIDAKRDEFIFEYVGFVPHLMCLRLRHAKFVECLLAVRIHNCETPENERISNYSILRHNKNSITYSVAVRPHSIAIWHKLMNTSNNKWTKNIEK